MRPSIPLLSFLLVAAGCAAGDGPTTRAAESELAQALAGRSPGEARNCVPIQSGRALRTIDAQTLLYDSGDTIWVNRLEGRCPGLRPSDPLIVEPTGSQYCRGDRIRSLDPVSRIPGPVCILSDFVPYRR
jgi:hypothetical protein